MGVCDQAADLIRVYMIKLPTRYGRMWSVCALIWAYVICLRPYISVCDLFAPLYGRMWSVCALIWAYVICLCPYMGVCDLFVPLYGRMWSVCALIWAYVICLCPFSHLFKKSLNTQFIRDMRHLLWIFDENPKYEKIIWRQRGSRLISLSKALGKTIVWSFAMTVAR